MTHRRQPGHTAGGTLASLSRHPHACPTHEWKQCHTVSARWQGRRKQAACTSADEGSRRITGSMEAEWTEPTRRGPPPLSSSAARSSVLAHAVHEGCRGGDASLMGCSPGGIAAPNGVAWTWVRSPAVRERIILLFRPPILCMANPLNVWCTTVTDLVNTRRTTAEYDFRSCAPQPRSNRTARLYYTANDR